MRVQFLLGTPLDKLFVLCFLEDIMATPDRNTSTPVKRTRCVHLTVNQTVLGSNPRAGANFQRQQRFTERECWRG